MKGCMMTGTGIRGYDGGYCYAADTSCSWAAHLRSWKLAELAAGAAS